MAEQIVEGWTGPRDRMPTHEEHILRILGEATEPLFPSEITELLNHELRPGAAYMTTEVATRPLALANEVAQLPDGRWMLTRYCADNLVGTGGTWRYQFELTAQAARRW